jgi:putative molybdopterin biosynthesis protein
MDEGEPAASGIAAAVRRAARQEQFLEVVAPEEATARFHRHLRLAPLGAETVALAEALGRVLAEDLVAAVDVPAFDRSSVDGFALRAADTTGANARSPRRLALNPEVITPGLAPAIVVAPGTATVIATGGMLPRGADAVLMVEHSELATGDRIEVLRAAAPGQMIAAAGSDMARGETVLRHGRRLGSREVGMAAAVGAATLMVWRRPRVAVLSTGDEIVAPGTPLRPGQVHDSNAAILAAAITEAGGEPLPCGIVRDDAEALEAALRRALAQADLVVLSGGTSKGAGDLSHRVAARLGPPGILVHGVALKPGKPLCLALVEGRPLVVLPGFPTSAIFTFHEFVAPVIRAYAGRRPDPAAELEAVLAAPLASERGRAEYVMTSLVESSEGWAAYPTAKGSGTVTAFGQADGFFRVPQQSDGLPAGSRVVVRRIGGAAGPADLVIVGSHCVGLDLLLGRLEDSGFTAKAVAVGSLGGLAAARRGECDLAGIHLLDPATGRYNAPFLVPGLELVPGYGRLQGVLFRPDDPRFAGCLDAAASVAAALADPACLMVNRNAGSGTRILIDALLGGARPSGWWVQPKSHNAVAAAVAQGRADWGVAIDTVARLYGLGFLPLAEEHYDFLLPTRRRGRPAVRRFLEILAEPSARADLQALGFRL